jgi:hypothetical protein
MIGRTYFGGPNNDTTAKQSTTVGQLPGGSKSNDFEGLAIHRQKAGEWSYASWAVPARVVPPASKTAPTDSITPAFGAGFYQVERCAPDVQEARFPINAPWRRVSQFPRPARSALLSALLNDFGDGRERPDRHELKSIHCRLSSMA